MGEELALALVGEGVVVEEAVVAEAHSMMADIEERRKEHKTPHMDFLGERKGTFALESFIVNYKESKSQYLLQPVYIMVLRSVGVNEISTIKRILIGGLHMSRHQK